MRCLHACFTTQESWTWLVAAVRQQGGSTLSAGSETLWAQGFWLNNGLCQWPVNTLTVGTVTYDKAQLVRIMDAATGNDVSGGAGQLAQPRVRLLAGTGGCIARAMLDELPWHS